MKRKHIKLILNVLALTALVVPSLAATASALERGTPVKTSDAATSNTSTTTGSSSTSTDATRLANIKSKGDQEIQRRLKTLNNLLTIISGATKLTTSDKATLTAEVNTEISGLATLETTLNNETTVSGAVQDVATMVTEYRVYALIVPKIQIIRRADDQQVVEGKLTDLAAKLSTRISQAQSSGKDVTTLTNELTTMKSQISAAQTISVQVETTALVLQPNNYDANHSILSGYATQLATAHSDAMSAYSTTKTIVGQLKNL